MTDTTLRKRICDRIDQLEESIHYMNGAAPVTSEDLRETLISVLQLMVEVVDYAGDIADTERTAHELMNH